MGKLDLRRAHKDSPKLVEHPVLGRIESLQVLLGATRHGCGSLVLKSVTERVTQ